METKRKKAILSQIIAIILAIIILALGFLVGYFIEKSQEYSKHIVSSKNSSSQVASYPPKGWYIHDVPAPEGEKVILLTQSPEKVTTGEHFSYNVGDHIGVAIFKTDQSPHQFVDITLGAMQAKPNDFFYKTWSKCNGSEMFSYAYKIKNSPKQKVADIFQGNKVFTVTLSPDKDQYHRAYEQVVDHFCKEK